MPPDEWVWDFGDGTTGSGSNPSHTYSAPGTYTVRMTEWGRYSGGSTWSISQDVTILA